MPRKAEKPSHTVDASEISIGDRVHHDKWGAGLVMDIRGIGDRAEADVRFEREGVKRLLLAWAPIRKDA
jgi:DNA helicase-2/ATP-dependent DNA helicase PcrA